MNQSTQNSFIQNPKELIINPRKNSNQFSMAKLDYQSDTNIFLFPNIQRILLGGTNYTMGLQTKYKGITKWGSQRNIDNNLNRQVISSESPEKVNLKLKVNGRQNFTQNKTFFDSNLCSEKLLNNKNNINNHPQKATRKLNEVCFPKSKRLQTTNYKCSYSKINLSIKVCLI